MAFVVRGGVAGSLKPIYFELMAADPRSEGSSGLFALGATVPCPLPFTFFALSRIATPSLSVRQLQFVPAAPYCVSHSISGMPKGAHM
jgi:hypothetical protein